MKERRILEIGPGPAPLHNRGDFSLNNEEYIGLDLNNVFSSRIWKQLKAEYGNKLQMLQGDRVALPFHDQSMDEIVMLGTAPMQEHTQYLRAIEEADRVLTSGGIIRIGVGLGAVNLVYDTWGVKLQQMGYVFLPDEKKEYDYSKVRQKILGANSVSIETPYIVIAYKKS